MKRILSVILALSVILTLSACAGKDVDKSPKIEGLGRVYIQSFENYKDMFNCQFDNFYGKIDLSTDYKTDGDKSAKIIVEKLVNSVIAPKLTVGIRDEGYGYDFSDFGMIDYVGFSIKNANDFPSTVHFYVQSEDGNNLIESYCNIDAGETQDFRFKNDRVLASLRHDNASSMCFDFDVTAGVWYMDGLYVEKAYKPVSVTEKNFTDDTLFTFEESSEVNYLLPAATYTSSVFKTTLSQFGGALNNGGNSLKLTFDKVMEISRDEEVQPQAYYSGFKMGNLFMEKFDFSRLTNKDLSIDVFNATGFKQKLIIEICDDFGITFDKIVEIQPNEWQTVLLTAKDIDDAMIDKRSVSKLAFYFDTHEFVGTSVFYLDNIVLKETIK